MAVDHNAKGALDHNRLLTWMKAPSPRYLVRYFRCWEIENIFYSITRTPRTRSELQLRIEELVQKRNNIAHGDLSIEATHTDVALYRDVTMTFSERADRILGKVIGKLNGATLGMVSNRIGTSTDYVMLDVTGRSYGP